MVERFQEKLTITTTSKTLSSIPIVDERKRVRERLNQAFMKNCSF